jgi:chromosomal replication initiation ATPase DnaA
LDDELKKEIAAEFPENKQPLFFSGVTGEGLTELKDAIWKHCMDKKILIYNMIQEEYFGFLF